MSDLDYFSPMANDFNLLTSSQAAGLLEVHESSVKRWTNEGALRPIKTKGGHRRIALTSLIEFARNERPDATLLKLAPFEADVARVALAARERNDFGPMAGLIVRLCDTHPPGYLIRAFRYLESACGVPLTRCFDLGVAEAMRRIGKEWTEGLRSVAREHRFTQKILDCLYGLRASEMEMSIPTAPMAVVGCAETSYHEIGAMFVRLALEAAGWQVCYLGSNVPYAELGLIQAELKARLVAVSFVPPCGNADAKRCMATLAAGYRPERPFSIAMGGGGLDPESLDLMRKPFLGAKVWKSTEALQAWAKSQIRSRPD
ncbi:MAG: binding domain protein excisionase family [Fibrobacteres bacterium]|nr:binding domain protein excisionase family [Fibrobacterota bacterium]